MNCREFTELAAAWLDGELAGERRAACREHLSGCGTCARLLEDLAEVDRAVKAEPAAERPGSEWESFNRRLMVRIAMDERRRAGSRAARARRLWRSAVRISAAAAALVLAAWGGFALRDRLAPGPLPGERRVVIVNGPRLDGLGGPELAALDVDRREELERLLAAAERLLLRLKNADPADPAELAAIRSAVIDTGLAARLSEARRSSALDAPMLAEARPVEMVLLRVSNGNPAEAEEFREIRNLVLDGALVERTRSLRSRM